jgi:hypothetical protein
MGWTTTTLPYNGKMTDELKRMFTWENDAYTYKVLDSSLVRFRTWYAAIERVEKEGSKSREVFAAIVLVRVNSRAMEYSYKEMTEDAGPCERECPKKILNLLTPTTSKYAIGWRADCWSRFNKASKRPRLRTGHHIIFDEPLDFTNGMSSNVFYIIDAKRRQFRIGDAGVRVSLTRSVLNKPYVVLPLKDTKYEDLPTLIGDNQAVNKEVKRRMELFQQLEKTC